jgi:hypothetical protein
LWDELDDRGWWLEIGEVEVFGTEFFGDGGPEFIFGIEDAVVHDDGENFFAVIEDVLSDVVGLAGIEGAASFKHVHYVLGCHGEGGEKWGVNKKEEEGTAGSGSVSV